MGEAKKVKSRNHQSTSESRTVSKEANQDLEVRQQTAAPLGGPTPVGKGGHRRLTCGCIIIATQDLPKNFVGVPYPSEFQTIQALKIQWCAVHSAASELLYELGAINDALENRVKIVIEPGSVRHQRIQKVVDKADAGPRAVPR